MSRALAAEAEYQRSALARLWLGQELPLADDKCVIQYTLHHAASTGASTFTFRNLKDSKTGLNTAKTELSGEFLDVLTNVLPHEVMHIILATHFGRPVPRWADEGIAVAAEDADSQSHHDETCRKLLNEGRGVRLKVLFRMTDYPRDLLAVYAQGHSVVRFLLTRPVTVGSPVLKTFPQFCEQCRTVANPHQQLIIFLHIGLDGNNAESWDKAAKAIYDFGSVDALEDAWLKYLEKPESRLKRNETQPKPKRDEKPDLIPPTRLPGEPR
jgi:hypothetical protein